MNRSVLTVVTVNLLRFGLWDKSPTNQLVASQSRGQVNSPTDNFLKITKSQYKPNRTYWLCTNYPSDIFWLDDRSASWRGWLL